MRYCLCLLALLTIGAAPDSRPTTRPTLNSLLAEVVRAANARLSQVSDPQDAADDLGDAQNKIVDTVLSVNFFDCKGDALLIEIPAPTGAHAEGRIHLLGIQGKPGQRGMIKELVVDHSYIEVGKTKEGKNYVAGFDIYAAPGTKRVYVPDGMKHGVFEQGR